MTTLHARFLSFLPRIEAHARVYFRDVRCRDTRADRIAETIALAWKWFLRLEERGKDATKFVSAIATYAVKAVRSGRRVAGMARSKDVMNPITQRRHGFAVEKLPEFSTLTGNPLTEALADNMVTPPPDAAAFRVDFPPRRTHLETSRSTEWPLADHQLLGQPLIAIRQRLGRGRLIDHFCRWQSNTHPASRVVCGAKPLPFSRLEEQQMYNILGSIVLAYLAGSGTVTNSGVVGRGLFREVRRMADGEYREAGVETLAALAAPALMSYASTASLVPDVVDGPYELAGPAMEEGDIRRFRETA